MSHVPQSDAAARARVTEMITGCWRTQVIHEAVRLGLPDLLAACGSSASAPRTAAAEVQRRHVGHGSRSPVTSPVTLQPPGPRSSELSCPCEH